MIHHISQISARVSCETIIVTPFEQNCRILWDSESLDCVIVDPGYDLEKIYTKLAQYRVKPQAIWITHGHIDHAGQAKEAAEKFDIKIIGPHIADKPLLANLVEYSKKYDFFENVQNCCADKWLQADDELEIGDVTFKVMHVPGHSPGHVAFYSAANNLLIGGDILFYNSVGRTDLPFSDQEQLKKSLKTMVLPLPDATRVLSGHGADFTLGEIRTTNPFVVRWSK